MRVCLVRHGETAWNREHRMQGWTDIALNDQGQQQALAVARALQGVAFDAIVSSPLQRALQTAQAVAAGREIVLEPRLRERHHGDLQGLTRSEMAEHYPHLAAALNQRLPGYQPPGGESIETFAERVREALADLHAQHAGQTVLVLAHGGVLDVAFRLASGQDLYSPRRHALPNAALNWLAVGPQGWQIESIGLTAHLERQAEEDIG